MSSTVYNRVPTERSADYADRDTLDDSERPTRWVTLWPNISRRQLIIALLSLVGGALTVAVLVGSFLGLQKYRKLSFPHRAVHASLAQAKDGTNIVEPYFQPEQNGLKLITTLWFREGNPATIETSDSMPPWMRVFDDVWTSGGQGFLLQEKHENPWVQVWTGELDGLSLVEKERRLVESVSLPGHIVHSLVTKRSDLVATFALIPSAEAAVATYTHTSSRPTSAYGVDGFWPLPFDTDQPTTSRQLNAFLAHSAAGHTLNARIPYWEEATPYDNDSPFDRDLPRLRTYLASSTDIVLVKDHPKYNLDGFQKAMAALRSFKEQCSNSSQWIPPDCSRDFERDGHFENLLRIEQPGRPVQYAYSPYLTATPSPLTWEGSVVLPTLNETDRDPNDVAAFTFDWHLTFRALSPLALSMSNLGHTPDFWALRSDVHDGHEAVHHDSQELFHALIGISTTPGSRPIARSAMGIVSNALQYLAVVLLFHYWMTRQTTTGIAILTLSAQTLSSLICYIIVFVVNYWQRSLVLFILVILGFIALFLKQIKLLARPQFKWALVTVSHDPDVRISLPIAIRLCPASKAEANGRKLDAQFAWYLRVLIILVTFLIFRFAPAPSVIAAIELRNVMYGFGGAVHWNPDVLSLLYTVGCVQNAVWFGCQLSQILLNYRSETFAGSYAITAYASCAAQSLIHITQIFSGWFGRPRYHQPLMIWDIIMWTIMIVMAVQAATLPKVVQKS